MSSTCGGPPARQCRNANSGPEKVALHPAAPWVPASPGHAQSKWGARGRGRERGAWERPGQVRERRQAEGGRKEEQGRRRGRRYASAPAPPSCYETFESPAKCNRRARTGPTPGQRASLPDWLGGPPNGAGPPAALRRASVTRRRDSHETGSHGQFNQTRSIKVVLSILRKALRPSLRR